MLFHPLELIQILNQHTVRGIIHVGAHLCEEKDYYNKILQIPDNKILWVEGNPKTASEAKEKHPTANIVTALCSNENDKTVNFMITNNGQSSSFLELGTHSIHHPEIVQVDSKELQTTTLDLVCNAFEWTKDCNFINLDVQGAEKLVLEGGKNVLKHIDFVYAEINCEEIYKGCCLLPEFDNFLEGFGFKRVGTKMTEWNWGDALYVKVSSKI